MRAALFLTAGLFPLAYAWRANRHTTLRPALAWGLAAWAAWAGVAGWAGGGAGTLGRYLALSLTGCAGVAVLGARRPGVGAWQFVVGGLLLVLLLPVAEGLGQPRLQPAHLIFLAAVLAVAVVNYLPTRLAAGALLLGCGCGIEIARLAGAGGEGWWDEAGLWSIAAAPWAALAGAFWPGGRDEPDRTWLLFRDRFGLLWGLRAREQFNRAAANAGWPVVLHWQGFAGPAGPEVLAALRGVLKRFGPAETANETAGPQVPSV